MVYAHEASKPASNAAVSVNASIAGAATATARPGPRWRGTCRLPQAEPSGKQAANVGW